MRELIAVYLNTCKFIIEINMKNLFKTKTNNFRKTVSLLLAFLFAFFTVTPVLSFEDPYSKSQIIQRIETKPEDIPNFTSPVCLLVGLQANELSYKEISSLTGFELFSVPYRSDLKTLTEQIKPQEVIIKHPSGFVGLYSAGGELIRGVQTVEGATDTAYLHPEAYPPSIIQPYEANAVYENVYYPGSITGSVPHGGIGYVSPPKGRGVWRHFLKLAALTGLAPFQYPGYFMAYSTYNEEKLFPALVLPNVPLAIGAASSYADSRFEAQEYNDARTQPRDYKFQPVIEGY